MFHRLPEIFPAGPGIVAGPVKDTVPGVADVEVVVVGCNMAVGSNQLHPVDHTEVASAAADTASLPWNLESGPASPLESVVVPVEVHMTALDMDCLAVSGHEGCCPLQTTEVFS